MKQRWRKSPIYQRLSAELRSAIEEGHFGEDGRLPTEAELCREYKVSRHTVRQAFQDLVAEGLVRRVPGRGTFATRLSRRGRYLRSIGSVEELMSWAETDIEIVSEPRIQTNAEAAAQLELSTDEVATVVVRRIYDGVPFVVTHVYLRPEAGKSLEADGLPTGGSGTILGTLERLMPGPIVGASQDITAISAPEDISQLIDCEPGEPILYVERIYFSGDGDPVEFAISYYNPRRYSYHLELRQRIT